MEKRHDLIVIGGGPGGYTSAIRAAQLGMDVACVDANDTLGGTCLRVGCIPSKALLESSALYAHAREGLADHGVRVEQVALDLASMHRRKEGVVATLTKGIDALFAKNKVTRYTAMARLAGGGRVLLSGHGSDDALQADRILIATGSKPTTIPGVHLDRGDGTVSTSTEALSYPEVPDHLIVIGAGYIGLELGSIWLRLGARVTVIEMADRILPGADREMASRARSLLARQGMQFMLQARVQSATSQGGVVDVNLADGRTVQGDRLLVAVGRTPNTDGLGLDELGVQRDSRGFIQVDDTYATNVRGIYAVGDVIGGPMLAHKAEREGIACVEQMAGHAARVNYDTIPSVAYIEPELASVGPTEEQLAEQGVPYQKGTFPLRANGRAWTMGATDGLVKVLAHRQTDRLLAVHILARGAGELIAQAAAAIEFGASSEDLFHVTYAHPTVSESMKEAALAVHRRAIHSVQ